MGMGSAAGPAECAPSGVSPRSASPKPNETTEGGDSSRLGASLASLRRRRGAPGATGAPSSSSPRGDAGSGGSSGSDPDSRSPSPPPPGASTPVHGFLRARARSFGSLLHDATRGGVMTTLEGVSRRFATTLERELGRHLGPAGAGVVEIYRFAWRRFNRRVVFHIVFYSILGAILFALWALVAFNLWRLVGQWILRRVVWRRRVHTEGIVLRSSDGRELEDGGDGLESDGGEGRRRKGEQIAPLPHRTHHRRAHQRDCGDHEHHHAPDGPEQPVSIRTKGGHS